MTYRGVGGGRGSVVRESELQSEDPGFDALAGAGREPVFSSLRVASGADLFVRAHGLIL